MSGAYDLRGKRVWVAGHRGMVGGALVRRLAREDCTILTASRTELNLLRQADVESWVAREKPQAVFLAAARVGGILANASEPATFIYENLAIETNIIHAAFLQGVEKLIFLGSSCIYPKFAPQPIPESSLLTGSLEPTNESYAIAKIAGIKLCQAYRAQHGCDFVSGMPTNLYGPGDNFDLRSSHVLPALIRKAHDAKVSGGSGLDLWGSGTPRREMLHVDDCADALVHLMKTYSAPGHVNIGFGDDVTINDMAKMVMVAVGLSGDLCHDLSKPDGTPRKLMDSSLLRSTGWRPAVALKDGIASTYAWFLANAEKRT